MIRRLLVISLSIALLAPAAWAFDSIDLTYLPNGGPCDGQFHEVEWKNTTGATRTVTKVIVTGIGTPVVNGLPLVNTGVWSSEVKVEAADGTYKTIALAVEEAGKASAASTFDYPDGSVVVQPGESLVHKTFCNGTSVYYAWVYVLTR